MFVQPVKALVISDLPQKVKEAGSAAVYSAMEAWLRVLWIVDVLVYWTVETGSQC
jgi:hypothetical protein